MGAILHEGGLSIVRVCYQTGLPVETLSEFDSSVKIFLVSYVQGQIEFCQGAIDPGRNIQK